MRSFWDRMLGRRAAAAPLLSVVPGERPAGNAVHIALDEADIPWRLTRKELSKRYGVRKHPAYGWQDIFINTRHPFVAGLCYPLAAHVLPAFSPHLPATDFMSATSFGTDARRNIRLTAEELAQRLGEITIEEHYNTVHCVWNYGAAEVRLTAWPPDLQRPMKNKIPAHRRDPRLRTACIIAIKTGYRLAPTAQERAWLDSFVAVGPARFAGDIPVDFSDTHAAYQGELEFVREPGPERAAIFGKVGLSADGEALMFCYSQLFLIPVARVNKVIVTRLLPGRGPGGSNLVVECATDYAEMAVKRPMIGTAKGIDDMTELGKELADAMHKPCEVVEAYDE
ncbi:MAG TPA: hypothetical protein VKB71_02205 [Rhizomicrobium sp.]|nr:hypothetical protein [Rhizomicrobium sp.]